MEQRKFNNILIFSALIVIVVSLVFFNDPPEKKQQPATEPTPIIMTPTPAPVIDQDNEWAVTIDGLKEETIYKYMFLIDGEQKTDPLNPNTFKSKSGNVYSVFEFSKSNPKAPELDLEKGMAKFSYYGEIKNNARLIMKENDWEWSTDEFEPVGDKAKAVADSIIKNEELGVYLMFVLKEDNSEVIPGAKMLLKPMSNEAPGSRTARTSIDGSVVIEGIYPCKYIELISKEGKQLFDSRIIEIRPSKDSLHTIRKNN